MAYDSATDTALAGQAYQRALATAAQKRDTLNRGFGLRADGSMDGSAAGQLGSIYQGNLQSVQADEAAQTSDRRRGFGTGGLGGKATAAAEMAGQQRQALGLADAASQLGGVTQEEQAAGQDYQSNIGNIAGKSAFDLATTLAANPVLAPVDATSANGNPARPLDPKLAAAQRIALSNNPRAAQVARNARY